MVLRHQVRVLERQVHGRVRYRPADRAILAALSRLLPRARWRCFLVAPDTLLRWHRELAQRRWQRWRAQRGPGRPPMNDELVELIVRLGRENRRWGCVRTHPGRAAHAWDPCLNHFDSEGPARTWSRARSSEGTDMVGVSACPGRCSAGHGLLHRGHHLDEAALRALRHRARDSRSAHPRRDRSSDGPFRHAGGPQPRRRPRRPGRIHKVPDSGSGCKFTTSFDEVFTSEGIRVIKTPVRSPRANAYAERWVRTVRTECLDWMLVLGRRHLNEVLRQYVSHYNEQRPHPGLDLGVPVPSETTADTPVVPCQASRCTGRPHPRILPAGRVVRPWRTRSSCLLLSRQGGIHSGWHFGSALLFETFPSIQGHGVAVFPVATATSRCQDAAIDIFVPCNYGGDVGPWSTAMLSGTLAMTSGCGARPERSGRPPSPRATRSIARPSARTARPSPSGSPLAKLGFFDRACGTGSSIRSCIFSAVRCDGTWHQSSGWQTYLTSRTRKPALLTRKHVSATSSMGTKQVGRADVSSGPIETSGGRFAQVNFGRSSGTEGRGGKEGEGIT